MSLVRIDNCIVEKFETGGGLCIGPILYFMKKYKKKGMKFEEWARTLEDMAYVSTGSRRTDGLLIQRLLSGSVKFDDLDLVYPCAYVLK